MKKLIARHPALKSATAMDGSDPPDAVITLAGRKLGFELTDIHAQGEVSNSGNTAVKYGAQSAQLTKELAKRLSGLHENLDQSDVLITFRANDGPFDPANLPPKGSWPAFADALAEVLTAQYQKYVVRRAGDLVPLDVTGSPLLAQYVSELEVRVLPAGTVLNVMQRIHDVALTTGYISTPVAEIEQAIVRKSYVRDVPTQRIKDATLDEYYLVLGGRDPRGLMDLQLFERETLLTRLTYVRVPFESIQFEGIIFFDEFHQTVEVLCSKCLAKVQKDNRVGVGLVSFWHPNLFAVPHDCPSLVLSPHRQ